MSISTTAAPLFRRYETQEAARAAEVFVNDVARAEMPEAVGTWFVAAIYPEYCGCGPGESYNSNEGHCYGCGESQQPVEFALMFMRSSTWPQNTAADEAANAPAFALRDLAERRWSEKLAAAAS
jgi:hypothetical protein